MWYWKWVCGNGCPRATISGGSARIRKVWKRILRVDQIWRHALIFNVGFATGEETSVKARMAVWIIVTRLRSWKWPS